MKNYKLFVSILTAFVAPMFAVNAQVAGQNLIVNPSCEDSAANNKIPSWVEVSGFDWQRQRGGGDFSPACDGQYIFYAGAKDSAELRQDITVTAFSSLIDAGIQYFVFRGYVRSYPQNPPDTCRIVLEYRTDTVSAPLHIFDTHSLCNTTQWQLVKDSVLAPKGTRIIRIRLISTRFDGAENDGYYDALSLVAQSATLGVTSKFDQSPKDFRIAQNYPNPFNPSTMLEFTVPYNGHARLRVFNILGEEVATLFDGDAIAGTYHHAQFNASNLPSGIYFSRLEFGGRQLTQKMVLMK